MPNPNLFASDGKDPAEDALYRDLRATIGAHQATGAKTASVMAALCRALTMTAYEYNITPADILEMWADFSQQMTEELLKNARSNNDGG